MQPRVSCIALLTSAPLVAALANTVNRAGHKVVAPRHVNRRALDDEPNPYTCDDGATAAEDWKVHGPNLGGWLVLEPWITPSLFYQFLSESLEDVSWDDKWGKDAGKHTAMDSYTFCESLGPVEGNVQMRRHWAAWVREEDIKAIAATGATHVRIPIGDWMYKPYGPYIGCMDGARDELERALALCAKHGLKALLDLHAVRGSQNGFDNSGRSADLKWGSEGQLVGWEMTTITTFQHWTIRAAHWMGTFDHETDSYPLINHTNIDFTLAVLDEIIDAHKSHSAVWGLEPVNEPWQFTPLDELKAFYWKGYHAVRDKAPHWMYVMHDSFRGYPAAWWGFMKGCANKALDTHIYQAWNRPGVIGAYYSQACGFKDGVRTMEDLLDMPLIVGEWSLATDNCAMWLNGFNDNLPGFPKVVCQMQACAEPYMGTAQPGTPPSAELPLQGPYGTGVSGPQFGQCPVGYQWGSKEDEYMTTLAAKLQSSYNSGHGWFFWNFRTEIEPRWSFIDAHSRGWFQDDVSAFSAADALDACPPQTQAETRAGTKTHTQAHAVAVRPLTLVADRIGSARGGSATLAANAREPPAADERTAAPPLTSLTTLGGALLGGFVLIVVAASLVRVRSGGLFEGRLFEGSREGGLAEQLMGASGEDPASCYVGTHS